MRRHWSIDVAFILPGPARNKGEIFLASQIVLKLMRNMLLGRLVFGEEQNAGCVLIDSMHQAQARVLLAAVGEFEKGGDFLKGAGLFTAPGDRSEAGGLGDGGGIGILPESV